MEEERGIELWGYYPTTPEWLPIQVNANGEIIVVTE